MHVMLHGTVLPYLEDQDKSKHVDCIDSKKPGKYRPNPDLVGNRCCRFGKATKQYLEKETSTLQGWYSEY